MRFQCTQCRGIVAIDDSEAGQAVACGHCGAAVAVPGSRFAPGAALGDFVIRKELGGGGMGTVFLAHQLSLDRDVALKVLHAQFSQDEDYIGDFVREARAAARLNHPSIVQAYAVGEDEGIYYFAMEFVEGSTLKQVLIHGGRIVVERALAIASEMAEALDFAWKNQQLVHGDIKPDNIILTAGGRTKLADLGLARVVGDVRGKRGDDLFGTPQYIAPEQLLGSPPDNRCDIYSLGATLYNAVTGRFPYLGDTPADTARRHLTEPLTLPCEVIADIPKKVSRVIEIMLAKRPEHRYQDASELVADLARLRVGQAPLHELHPDAQKPIDYLGDGEESGEESSGESSDEGKPAADKGGGGRKVKLSLSGHRAPSLTTSRQTRKPGAGSTGAAPRPAPADDDKAEPAVAPPDSGGGWSRALLALVIAGAVAAAALVPVYFGLTGGFPASGPAPVVEDGDLIVATSPAARDDFRRVRGLIQSAPSDVDRALADVASFMRLYPEEDTLVRELRTLATPLVETQIRALRALRHEEERRTWETQADQLAEQARLEREAEERRLAQEAERRRLEAEEQRKAEEQRRYLERMATEQDRLRREAVRLCRENEYHRARQVFAQMAQSDDQTFSAWAKNKQQSIEFAEKTFNLVHNSRDKLKNLRFVIPERPHPRSRVGFIGRRSVDVVFLDLKIHDDGRTEDVIGARVSVPLTELSPTQMWELAKASWEKDGGREDELRLYFGAYLVAQARQLTVARNMLRTSSRTDSIGPMLEEITVMSEAGIASQ